MKDKIENIFDKIAYGTLLVLGFAGFLQIFVIFWLSLFGIQFHWLQYISTIVLFGLGIFALVIWAKFSSDEQENK